MASQIHAMTVMSGRRFVEQVLQDLDDAERVERLDQMTPEAGFERALQRAVAGMRRAAALQRGSSLPSA
jgi:hypothetical protein